MGRFDYVRYDDIGMLAQDQAKTQCKFLENFIERSLKSPRARSLALTKLEECYMWIGKAIRDDQIARNGGAPLMEERKND